jgi:ABC-type Fe3+-citrate transport system substrate-binding protein
MAEITTSLDWGAVQQQLEAPVFRLKKHHRDMLKMSDAIGAMVKKLSEEEINCRRMGRQTQKHKELLAEINKEISNYEQYLTFGVLLNG